MQVARAWADALLTHCCAWDNASAEGSPSIRSPGGRCIFGQNVRWRYGASRSRRNRLIGIVRAVYGHRIVRAFERAGVEGLSDAGPAVLFQALTLIKYMRSHRDCEEKVRSLGSGLVFAIEHSLVYSNKYGVSSGATATQICESLPNHNVHLASS